MTPTTAAIVVTYRSADTIDRCVKALADADVDQIIVWDNASDDRTVHRARTAIDHVSDRIDGSVIESSENLGYGRAINRAASLVDAELLLVCNPDAVVAPDAVARLVHHLTTNDGCGVVGPRLTAGGVPQSSSGDLPTLATELRTVAPRPLTPLLPRRRHQPDQDATGPVGYVEGACFMMRRSVLADIGGFDESVFLFYEEQELARRLAAEGLVPHLVLDAIVEHEGKASRSSLPDRGNSELLRSASQYLGRWHGPVSASVFRRAARLHWAQGVRRGRRSANDLVALDRALGRTEVSPA